MGWPKGDDHESISSRMKPAQIQSVAYMVKPERATSSPMERIRRGKDPLLVDSFVNNVANLFAVEREPFSMTSDLRRRRF